MSRREFTAESERDTETLGAALAEVLPDGTTVALVGTLGAGKTRLVQAIAAACGIPRGQVMSPTFVLCQEYHGQRSIYHLDAYRLSGVAEFERLGVEEYFAAPALTLIEWGDRVRAALPSDCWTIEIIPQAHDHRLFVIECPVEQASLLERLGCSLTLPSRVLS